MVAGVYDAQHSQAVSPLRVKRPIRSSGSIACGTLMPLSPTATGGIVGAQQEMT